MAIFIYLKNNKCQNKHCQCINDTNYEIYLKNMHTYLLF